MFTRIATSMFLLASAVSAELQTLTQSNFDVKVRNSKAIWLIEFDGGEHCVSCKALKKELKEASKQLAGEANFGVVDPSQSGLLQEFKISRAPTLKVIVPGKGPITYNGATTAAAIVEYVRGL